MQRYDRSTERASMDADRIERLSKYLATVTRSRGGLEGLLADLSVREQDGSPLESFGGESPVPIAAARSGIENLALGRSLTPEQFLSTEAIIDEELRPAVDVIDGHFDVVHPLWRELSQDAVLRQRIEAVLPSIGRIELPGHPRLPYGGTGFVTGDGLVMTNRHVAEVFARGVGDRRLAFVRDRRAGVDFRRDAAAGTTLRVQRVVMIHPYWDMALLAVEGLPATAKPLKLSLMDARDLVARRIFVVGYPAFDPRNPAQVQNDLFSGRYGVKRLQPGELQGGVSASSFGKIVLAAAHDCSTLGGNSGSAVVDLDTGEVMALHFGGAYHQMNYGVPAAALAKDNRVVDAGVQFAGTALGDPNDWLDWWRQADSEESGQPSTPEGGGSTSATRQASVPAAAPAMSVVQSPSGDVSLQVPLHITISLGHPQGGASGAVGAVRILPADGLDGTEAMREPFHEEGYTSRRGFDAAFLGKEVEFEVPLPKPHAPAALAPTLNGEPLLRYQNFSVAMHAKRRLALFTASNITKELALRRPEATRDYTRAGLSGLGKNDTERWFIDTRMDARYQLPDVFFTKDRQAFDKGHIVRREDVAWGRTYDLLRRANGDTYHVTNCSPQVADFNQSSKGEDNWGDLENHVLASAATERLCVFAGPVLAASDQVFVGVGNGGQVLRAKVPSRFWKVIVARVEEGIAAFGFVLDQDLSDVQWEEFVVPTNFEPAMTRISDIGAMTGIDFAEAVLDADQYDFVRGAELVARGVARLGS
jgi:endonuclease G